MRTSDQTVTSVADRRYRDADFLRTHYVEQRESASEIAAECGVASSTVSRWLGRHGITDGPTYERATCDNCDEPFRYAPSLREGVYCSNACANDQRKRQVTVDCVGCGETFERRASLDTEYCSIACWGEDTGANHGDFYTGIWHEQRWRAMRRDDNRCTVCGITNQEHEQRFGQELDVHHKVPVRLSANWDLPLEDAHTLRNLTTVCRTHHPDAPGETVTE